MRKRGEEARRSARVSTGFFVAIDGLDKRYVSRRGDISATGIYFETDTVIGEVGTVQFLHIASSNRVREVHVMAHVVRAITLEDIGGKKVYGVALEFMPESEDANASLERFVQYVLLVVDEPPAPETESSTSLPDSSREPRLSPRLAALALGEAQSDDDAVIRQLSVRSMTLEANWSVLPGERLRVEIAAPGRSRRVRLEGSAVRVTPLSKTDRPPYAIEVEFQSEVERPSTVSSMSLQAVRPESSSSVTLGKSDPPKKIDFPPEAPPSKRGDSVRIDAGPKSASSMLLAQPAETPFNAEDDVSRVLDDLFSALIHPPDDSSKPKREHLSGLLSRIRLPTLCALFDMERLSGELHLRKAEERATIYVQDGQLVDVDRVDAGLTPRAMIGRLLSWEEGAFEFDVHPIVRENRVGMTTTALLLDLAREADEGQESKRNPPA